MSETVKLIIEISKVPKNDHERWVLAHGTSLDDVKAEMQKLADDPSYMPYGSANQGLEDAIEILDNIGKGE